MIMPKQRPIKKLRRQTDAILEKLKREFPRMPWKDKRACAENMAKNCRPERYISLKDVPVANAVTAYARHNFTVYDQLLVAGCDRVSARKKVEKEVMRILKIWRNHKV
jgi:hypothetical protein